MTAWYDLFETPVGWMGVLGASDGLRRTTLPRVTPDQCLAQLGPEAAGATADPGRFRSLREDLLRLFHGHPVTFDEYEVDIRDATSFYHAAWTACRSIPLGETRSYAWLAQQAGSPGASRAAGQSMARNRLPIVVPCHRVIAGDGGMRGYGSGSSEVELKRWLLNVEAGRQPAALPESS